jgi:hypothetical protein
MACWRAAYREFMLVEPLPAGEEPAPGELREVPPSPGPPALEPGVVLALGRTAARSANVVVLAHGPGFPPPLDAAGTYLLLQQMRVGRRTVAR